MPNKAIQIFDLLNVSDEKRSLYSLSSQILIFPSIANFKLFLPLKSLNNFSAKSDFESVSGF